MKIYISAANSTTKGDFTVIQNIYPDWDEAEENDFVEPVYTQEYAVNLADVQRMYPDGMERASKNLYSEKFKAGDVITSSSVADYIIMVIGDDRLHSDFKAYVNQHPEFTDPVRDVQVVINNPNCFPSAEELSRKRSERMSRYLGKALLPHQ